MPFEEHRLINDCLGRQAIHHFRPGLRQLLDPGMIVAHFSRKMAGQHLIGGFGKRVTRIATVPVGRVVVCGEVTGP